jgi:hypothetical protein
VRLDHLLSKEQCLAFSQTKLLRSGTRAKRKVVSSKNVVQF